MHTEDDQAADWAAEKTAGGLPLRPKHIAEGDPPTSTDPIALWLARAAAPEHSEAEGLQAATRAAELAEAAGRPLDQGRAGAWICTRLMQLARHAEVLVEARRVLPLLTAPELRRERRELLRCVTVCGSEIGAFDVALDAAHELARLSQDAADVDTTLTASYALAVCLERMGDSWQAVRLLDEALRARGTHDPSRQLLVATNGMCAISIGMAHRLRGVGTDTEWHDTLARARHFGELALELLAQLPDPIYAITVPGNVGEIRLLQGEVAAARPMLEQALAQARARGLQGHAWRLQTSMADCLLAAGQPEQAREAAEQLLAEMARVADKLGGAPQQTAMRAHDAAYRACRALHHHEQALLHLEATERIERARTTTQLRALSQLFVTRTEAQQARAQAEHAQTDAQQQRKRATELAAVAERDPLTGLGNRRHLDRRCAELLPGAARDSLPLSLALLDIDHFKQVNDRHGHAVGDQVLMLVAQLLRDNTRAGDVLARYGGEEFVVVLPGMGVERAAEVCERLRKSVAACAFAEHGLAAGVITVSIGLASAGSYHLQGLLHAADAALYRAKREGRDRVAVGAR